MKSRTSSRWIAVGGLALFAAIAADTLAPVAWQVRLGLHWLIEHFLAYFALTIILCLAWPKPMAVAAVLIPLAVLLEATQALTPDRVPDAATALIDATAVAAAALLADRVIAWRKMAGAGRAAGQKPKHSWALAQPPQM